MSGTWDLCDPAIMYMEVVWKHQPFSQHWTVAMDKILHWEQFV
jgi:hypothetical protein